MYREEEHGPSLPVNFSKISHHAKRQKTVKTKTKTRQASNSRLQNETRTGSWSEIVSLNNLWSFDSVDTSFQRLCKSVAAKTKIPDQAQTSGSVVI